MLLWVYEPPASRFAGHPLVFPLRGVFAQLGEEWFNVCIAIVMNRKGDTPCIARRV